MYLKNLFICNTSFHLLIAQIFLKHFNIKADLVHTISYFDTLKYIDEDRWEDFTYITSLSPKNRKFETISRYRLSVIRFLLTGFNLANKDYDAVYIFNDCDITNQLLLKSLNYKKLIYLDDGLTIAGEFISSPKPKIKTKMKSIFGIHDHNFLSYNKKISEAYIFHSIISTRRDLNILELSDIIVNNLNYMFYLSERLNLNLDKYLNPDYVILTQPFSEQGICQCNEDVHVISKFIEQLPENSKIVLKRHPAEDSKKYDKITDSRVIKLESYAQIPYELLHIILKPSNLVSFYSTSLFTSQFFYKTKLISLVKDLNIPNQNEYARLLDAVFQNKIHYPPICH